jgi:hypothetical protein
MNVSSVSYFVKRLMDEGVILTVNNKYLLQPLFYEEKFWDDMTDHLMPIFDLISDYSVGEPDVISILYYFSAYIYKKKEKIKRCK